MALADVPRALVYTTKYWTHPATLGTHSRHAAPVPTTSVQRCSSGRAGTDPALRLQVEPFTGIDYLLPVLSLTALRPFDRVS